MSETPSALSGAPAPQAPSLSTSNIIGFAAMTLGMFMAILDIQIVASSLSEIQAGISASRDEISWVQTSYLIAEVIIIPLSGWLARVFSTRILFVASAATFTAASAACAFAWNLESMIVFRALQGFLGGAMIPTVFSASFALFPPSKRASVMVLIGLVTTMAPTLGPTLGGWVTDTLSWHWLFLLNVVPGVLASVVVFATLRMDKPDLSLLKGMDFLGIILVAVFLGTLQYVLEEGSKNDWLDDNTIATLSIVSAVTAVLFLWRELTVKAPVIELHAFGNANFSIGCVFSFILGVGLYGATYLLPLFLAGIRGYSAMQIGWVIMATGMFQFFSGPLAGRLSAVISPRVMLTIGLGLFGSSMYLNHFMTAEWGYWEFFLPQALRGFSIMFMFMPVNSMALGTLPPHLLKGGSGLYNLMRNLGGAIGLAVINTILNNHEAIHYSEIASTVTSARTPVPEALAAMQTMLSGTLGSGAELGALKTLQNIVLRESTVMAFADVFVLMALAFGGAILLVPLMSSAKSSSAPKGAPKPAEAH